jgi:hypothetical protein
MTDTGKPGSYKDQPQTPETSEDFLSRWSQRKSESTKVAAEPPAPQSTEPEQPVLTDEDMPPLESLDQDSDYSGFLSPGVSEDLRQLALSKLFRSAKFNVVDNMNDYAEDYTKWVPLGDVITCDMRFAMERAKEKLEQALGLQEENAMAAISQDGGEADQKSLTADDETSSEKTETPDEP